MPELKNKKQERFAQEWIKDCNNTHAAIRAGYSPKSARVQGQKLRIKPDIKARIDELMAKLKDETIADATEVLQFLTSMMRGEVPEEIVVVEGCGDGISQARSVWKQATAKERTKAAELLAKRYNLLSEKQEADRDAIAKLDKILEGLDCAAER